MHSNPDLVRLAQIVMEDPEKIEGIRQSLSNDLAQTLFSTVEAEASVRETCYHTMQGFEAFLTILESYLEDSE